MIGRLALLGGVVSLRYRATTRLSAASPSRKNSISAAFLHASRSIFIDTRTGTILHTINFEGVVTELYDDVALPSIRQPAMIGPASKSGGKKLQRCRSTDCT